MSAYPRHMGATHASHGLTREGQPRVVSRQRLRIVPRRRRWRRLWQKPRFLPKPRWAGQEARIQRFKLVTARSKVVAELEPPLATIWAEITRRIERPAGGVVHFDRVEQIVDDHTEGG